jgi:hypothetical protein
MPPAGLHIDALDDDFQLVHQHLLDFARAALVLAREDDDLVAFLDFQFSHC